jgi:hypothetical protein
MITHDDTHINLIAQFIISWRDSGHFLPYEDYEVIEEWLRINSDTDLILRTLSELLPKFYEKKSQGSKTMPLKMLSRKVAAKIRKN